MTLAGCRPVSSPWSSGIVFYAGNESQGRLYLYQFSDGKTRELTSPDQWVAPHYPHLVSWSDKVRRLVYVANADRAAELYTSDEGGAHQALTHNSWEDHSPQWSPSEPILGFISRQDDGMPRIYIMNYPTRKIYPLLSDPSILVSDFRWNNQGNKIALLASLFDEQPRFYGQVQPLHIYIVDVRTKSIIQKLEAQGVTLDKPSWSPDGRQLAYVAHTPNQHELRIWNLERNISYKLIQREDVWLAEWAPNGEYLAFIAGSLDERNPRMHLYVVDRQGVEVRDVTPPGISVLIARPNLWSPDSACLLTATREHTGRWAIRIIHWPTGRNKVGGFGAIFRIFTDVANGAGQRH